MSALVWLIPCALFLGGLGLVAFLWSLKANQFEDLEGAAWRALDDEPAKTDKSGRDKKGNQPGGR